MPLSCSCDYDFHYEPDYGSWEVDWQSTDLDFVKLATKKRKRCVSCGCLIDIGSLVIKYKCLRYPHNEVEEKITGCILDDEPHLPKAPIYHCEKCGEIYLNLTEVGFECLYPTENMPDMLKEFISTYDPPALNK